jgi:signal transduction histidine kinase
VTAAPAAPEPRPRWRRILPAATRIRGKLILLHTLFSLSLGIVLVLAIRPPLRGLVAQAEARECQLALEAIAADPGRVDAVRALGVAIRRGSAEALGLDADAAGAAREAGGAPIMWRGRGEAFAAAWDPGAGELVVATLVAGEGDAALERLYLFLTVSLLAIYAVIAIALEVFVLPRQVYGPIERLREADEAVQRGERERELIPEARIPADELGEIMRSRNRSIVKLREQERELARALERIEANAAELQRKNHLLEMAKRNLADQDRLASLGMMSAGIAHELNTPLAVLKGSVERFAEEADDGDRERIDLMLRVVRRLERLSESLLDFARVRPPTRSPVALRELLDEAWTLVRLDRGARGIEFRNDAPAGLIAPCDSDRMLQVFVNLIRNSVDAMGDAPRGTLVEARARAIESDGRRWASVTIRDSGPGLEPAVASRLFEPFATTKLDSRGTGLGLAVAEGIVREHEGAILARNAADPSFGAELEVLLPLDEPAPGADDAPD